MESVLLGVVLLRIGMVVMIASGDGATSDDPVASRESPCPGGERQEPVPSSSRYGQVTHESSWRTCAPIVRIAAHRSSQVLDGKRNHPTPSTVLRTQGGARVGYCPAAGDATSSASATMRSRYNHQDFSASPQGEGSSTTICSRRVRPLHWVRGNSSEAARSTGGVVRRS